MLPHISQRDQVLRKALFTPCETKEELSRWIKVFLGHQLPDQIVSDESNSCPMDMVWELYDRARRNDLDGFSRIMAYASRFSGKTFGASMLEVAIVLHMDRNVAHMAAIKRQSDKAQEYVKGFFNKETLRDFVVGDNSTNIVVVAFFDNVTGVPLTEKEFKKLTPKEQANFTRKQNYIRIVICNMAGANGEHVEFMVVDEIDVIPKQNRNAYQQAKGGIPVGRDGMQAVTLYTSTRKSRIGLVQQEIDKKDTTGLQLRHWNVIDVTEPCPPERHKPEQPRATYYVNDLLVKHIGEDEYKALADVEKHKWYPVEAFAGCKGCALLPACKGNLATKQKGKVGETVLLVKISEVIAKFRENPPEFITTEFLCRKPDTSGLVYARLNRDMHCKSPREIAEMVTGNPEPGIIDKTGLINLLRAKGARFASGMDFGFTHFFAVVTVAIWGRLAFVIDVVGRKELELDDKVAVCEHLRDLEPTIYGDPESPSDIKTFKRRGFKMREWDKGKGSVKAGIEIVRTKLYTIGNGPTLFFMDGDPSIEVLYQHMEKYAFTQDIAGEFTEEPDDENDDLPDAIRYCLMNVFGKQGAMKQEASAPEKAVPPPDLQQMEREHHANWMADMVNSLTDGSSYHNTKDPTKPVKKKKGGFIWDGG